MSELRTEAGRALLERMTPKGPSFLTLEDYFTRECMRRAKDLVSAALPAIQAEAVAPWREALMHVCISRPTAIAAVSATRPAPCSPRRRLRNDR